LSFLHQDLFQFPQWWWPVERLSCWTFFIVLNADSHCKKFNIKPKRKESAIVGSKTVKIQILRIRFLRQSESIFFVYNEKARGLELYFLKGEYWVIIRFYSSQNFSWIFQPKIGISSYLLVIWQFTLKFIDFLLKISVSWKLENLFEYFPFTFRILKKLFWHACFLGNRHSFLLGYTILI
jgi:hypothetical protein